MGVLEVLSVSDSRTRMFNSHAASTGNHSDMLKLIILPQTLLNGSFDGDLVARLEVEDVGGKLSYFIWRINDEYGNLISKPEEHTCVVFLDQESNFSLLLCVGNWSVGATNGAAQRVSLCALQYQ